jgi:hypothetical protein
MITNQFRFFHAGTKPTLEENPIKLFFLPAKHEKIEVLAREGEHLL